MSKKVEMSYFTIALWQYLKDSNSKWKEDYQFMVTRSESASNAYEKAIREGYNVLEAIEIANQILFYELDTLDNGIQ